ncbi:methyl-CpG-binding domain-containing protein 5-like [Fagus crenata]
MEANELTYGFLRVPSPVHASTFPRKNNKNTQALDFENPPETITWVLSDFGSDDWSPFTGDGETKVPDFVKKG